MNITFDTNVLLSATLWDGSVSQKALFYLIRTNATIYSSPAILREYQKVLKRDFQYTDEQITTILEKVLTFLTLINPKQKIDLIKTDPTDNKILECALESNSTYLLTYDKKHLLNLKKYKNTQILTPDEYLKVIQN